ncbi:MAG: hypothetical protein M1817_000962 [Caeruleum heppii]|nr:MAG: hypothetical protein M1817_000962 [Caeruleum heppii]
MFFNMWSSQVSGLWSVLLALTLFLAAVPASALVAVPVTAVVSGSSSAQVSSPITAFAPTASSDYVGHGILKARQSALFPSISESFNVDPFFLGVPATDWFDQFLATAPGGPVGGGLTRFSGTSEAPPLTAFQPNRLVRREALWMLNDPKEPKTTAEPTTTLPVSPLFLLPKTENFKRNDAVETSAAAGRKLHQEVTQDSRLAAVSSFTSIIKGSITSLLHRLVKRQVLTTSETATFRLAVFQLYVDSLALAGVDLNPRCTNVNVTSFNDAGLDGSAASSYVCAKATAPATSTTGSITVAPSDLTTATGTQTSLLSSLLTVTDVPSSVVAPQPTELNVTENAAFQLNVFKLYVDNLAKNPENDLSDLCGRVNKTNLNRDGIAADAASSYICAKATSPATSTTGSITVPTESLTSASNVASLVNSLGSIATADSVTNLSDTASTSTDGSTGVSSPLPATQLSAQAAASQVCNADNALRALYRFSTEAVKFCDEYLIKEAALPSYVAQYPASRVSSACTCLQHAQSATSEGLTTTTTFVTVASGSSGYSQATK